MSNIKILPDGRILFIAQDGQIWDPNTGKIDLTLKEKVENLTVLKDGRIVTSCSGNLQIWN